MMSGLASGLRSRVWQAAPPKPKQRPARRDSTARGSRSRSTVKEAPGTSCPASTRSTSNGATGVEPTESVTATDARIREDEAEHEGCAPAQATATVGRDLGGKGRCGGHSSRILRCRTIQMKTGAPTKAVTMPTSSSPGRARIRPSTSASISRSAPPSAAKGKSQR